MDSADAGNSTQGDHFPGNVASLLGPALALIQNVLPSQSARRTQPRRGRPAAAQENYGIVKRVTRSKISQSVPLNT